MKYLPTFRYFKNKHVREGAVAKTSRKNIPDFMYAITASFIVSIPLSVSEVNNLRMIYKTHANSMAKSNDISCRVFPSSVHGKQIIRGTEIMLYMITKLKINSQATKIDFVFGIIYQGESIASYISSSYSSNAAGSHVWSSKSNTSFSSISFYNEFIACFK